MPRIVQIIETETGRVEKAIPCNDERAAVRVERGVLINLNHDKYHTETVVARATQSAKGEPNAKPAN